MLAPMELLGPRSCLARQQMSLEQPRGAALPSRFRRGFMLQQHLAVPRNLKRRSAFRWLQRQQPQQDDYEQMIQECEIPLVVDFCTKWCGPCQYQDKVLTNVAPLYDGRVQFVKIDTEKHEGIAGKYSIHSLPTLILFQGGQVVERVEGFMSEVDLRLWLHGKLEL